MRVFTVLTAVALGLAACGPSADAPGKAIKPKAEMTGRALPTGPVLSGQGTVASVEGSTVTLDHDAVTGGLAAGRHVFTADASTLAVAPIEPGARIAFSYQDWTPQPLLTELKPR